MPEEIVMRCGDMHHNRSLELMRQRDGDVIVKITQDGLVINGDMEGEPYMSRTAQVEFCMSGGRSHKVLHKLYELMEAMEEDNRLNPIDVLHDDAKAR
jgi:hypothetical protein